jgi:hypothetical protein
MYNQVTDRFKLVQMELVKAVPAFGRTITAVEKYSLEVFRGEFHCGSVRIQRTGFVNNTGQEYNKMKVYSGDIIFWISLVPQPVSISGHLTTKDEYIRVYDVTFDLVVSNPVLFVQGYRLGKDPVHFAIEKIKLSLQGYASRTQHDKLVRIEKLNDGWNNRLNDDTGMRVLQISHWSLRDDPKRKEIDTVVKEAERNKVSVTKKAEIQKLEERLERERDSDQRAFEREQETIEHMHKLHLELRETAARELTDILRERIRYTFERGTPIDEVAEDSMRLLNAFHESLQRGSVVDSTLLSESGSSANGISSEETTTVRKDVETDELRHTSSDLSDLARTKEKEAEDE